MIKILKVFWPIIVVFLSIFLVLAPGKVNAAGYFVKPILVIPADWKDKITSDIIENAYKPAILKGMTQAQQFYAAKLNGHTFNFLNNVSVIYSSNRTNLEGICCATDVLRRLDVLPTPPNGEIDIAFVVGSADKNSAAYANDSAVPRTQDIAAINHNALEALASDNTTLINDGVDAIAHELGHTFGLTNAGWGGAHPCSISDPSQYIPSIQQSSKKGDIELPPATEWTGSVMGYGSIPLFPNTSFDNSFWNPEIQRIYKSVFINPNGDTAPNPSNPTPSLITGLSPSQVVLGSSFEINGSGFGNDKGSVILSNPYISQDDLPTIQITDWSAKNIKVSVAPGSHPQTRQTEWTVTVVTSSGQHIQAPNPIKIVPKTIKLSVKYSVVCGNDNSPSTNVLMTLKKINTTENIITSSSDDNGGGKLSTDIVNPQAGDDYIVSPDNLGSISSDPPFSKITIGNPPTDIDTNILFHLSACTGFSGPVSPSPSVTAIPSETPFPTVTSAPVLCGKPCAYASGSVCRSGNCPYGQDCDVSTCKFVNGCSTGGQVACTFGTNLKTGGKQCVYTNPSDKKCHLGNCLDGSQNCSLDTNCGYIPGYSSDQTVECTYGTGSKTGGKECIYSDTTGCFKGNCLDGSQNCSTNVNCGYVPGYSSGQKVDCNTLQPAQAVNQQLSTAASKSIYIEYSKDSGGTYVKDPITSGGNSFDFNLAAGPGIYTIKIIAKSSDGNTKTIKTFKVNYQPANPASDSNPGGAAGAGTTTSGGGGSNSTQVLSCTGRCAVCPSGQVEGTVKYGDGTTQGACVGLSSCPSGQQTCTDTPATNAPSCDYSQSCGNNGSQVCHGKFIQGQCRFVAGSSSCESCNIRGCDSTHPVGSYDSHCTGHRVNGCGELEVRQCQSNGTWSASHGECSSGCSYACSSSGGGGPANGTACTYPESISTSICPSGVHVCHGLYDNGTCKYNGGVDPQCQCS